MHEFFYSHDAQYARDPAAQPGSALVAIALWIRLGLFGASALIAALVSLIDSATRIGTVAAIAAAGGALALVAWLRIRQALREEGAEGAAARIGHRASLSP